MQLDARASTDALRLGACHNGQDTGQLILPLFQDLGLSSRISESRETFSVCHWGPSRILATELACTRIESAALASQSIAPVSSCVYLVDLILGPRRFTACAWPGTSLDPAQSSSMQAPSAGLGWQHRAVTCRTHRKGRGGRGRVRMAAVHARVELFRSRPVPSRPRHLHSN